MREAILQAGQFCLMVTAVACVTVAQIYVLDDGLPVTITEMFRCPMEGVNYLEAAYLHVPPLDHISEDFQAPTGKGATR